MSTTVTIEELIDYSRHERGKWREWIAAVPARLDIPFQADGRFPTIGSLLDHIFLVERRHLCRLEGGTPPTSTGVPAGDWQALFDYADFVRADLRRYVAELDEQQGHERMTIVAQSGTRTMTRRELLTHILLHEIRHLAQIAYAVRRAAQEPPGQHDIFYFVGTS
jgi:uncharacterized damage-inducible protein DinB